METLLQGMAIGLAIGAPVGPIGLLCIRRTLADGRALGLATGLGAATADACYGAVAAFGLGVVTRALVGQQLWCRLGGALFLVVLGCRILRAPPARRAADVTAGGLARAYVGTFVLTLTNPATILSFAAIFAGLGLVTQTNRAVALVLGVFAGSA